MTERNISVAVRDTQKETNERLEKLIELQQQTVALLRQLVAKPV